MGSANTAVFELTVPSRMEELEAIQDLVEKATKAFGWDEEIAHWIELTVSESTINAIQHGNGLDPSKNVSLSLACDGKAIEVIVEDQGPGFDISAVPDPTDTENLMKPGGRGILIIQAFMDKVEMERFEGGGSRLRMIKNLDIEQPA
jgi:serine/threonine-protein kinase RsbW